MTARPYKRYDRKAKEILDKLRFMNMEINSRIIQIDVVESYVNEIGVDYSKLKVAMGEGHSDKLADVACKVADMRDELAKYAIEYQDYKTEVAKALNAMPHALFRDVLTLRYVDGMKWHDIAERLDYSNHGIMGVHERALREFMGKWLSQHNQVLV